MTQEEPTQTLRRVLSIIESADVPEDLRAVAFQSVWSAMVGIPRGAGEPATPPSVSPENGDRIERFAQRLGVTPQEILDAFRLSDDGRFEVDVPSTRLPRERTAATIDLALLVCAGRQFSFEDATNGTDIRRVVEDFGGLDPANFAGTMAAHTDLWGISGGGRGRPAIYRLRRPAWNVCGETVRRLLGR